MDGQQNQHLEERKEGRDGTKKKGGGKKKGKEIKGKGREGRQIYPVVSDPTLEREEAGKGWGEKERRRVCTREGCVQERDGYRRGMCTREGCIQEKDVYRRGGRPGRRAGKHAGMHAKCSTRWSCASSADLFSVRLSQCT